MHPSPFIQSTCAKMGHITTDFQNLVCKVLCNFLSLGLLSYDLATSPNVPFFNDDHAYEMISELFFFLQYNQGPHYSPHYFNYALLSWKVLHPPSSEVFE